MPLRGDRPGLGGDRPQAKGLRDAGCDARDVPDAEVTGGEAIVWMSGNPGWYPGTLERLLGTPPSSRPFVVVWHSEPLPLPAAASFGRQRLSARELAKIALRDSRATDRYTNSRTLRRLARSGIPDLLVVNSDEMSEHLAEHGIDSGSSRSATTRRCSDGIWGSSGTSTCSSSGRSMCRAAGASSSGCGAPDSR
jgi:hypothetical protein